MKLKSCPFCGGEAKVIFDEESEHWRIRCKNIDCDVRPSTSWFYVKEEAIDRWNRRKPIDEIVKQLEELISYNKERSRMYDGHTHYDSEIMGISKAIEIVKSGGTV